jgi:hypothetical protein
MYKDPVGRDADLTCVRQLQPDNIGNSGIEIRILKNQYRCIAA